MRIFIFIIIATVVLPLTAPAEAESPAVSSVLSGSAQYSFSSVDQQAGDNDIRVPLGASGQPDPLGYWGVVVGHTWWENQRLGSMRRMIAWGTHDGILLVHFHWMYSPIDATSPRICRYNAYDANVGMLIWPSGIDVQPSYERAGYAVTDVTNDDRAILGCHNDIAGPYYQSHFYWDFGPGVGFFVTQCRVPDGFGADCEAIPPPPDFHGFVWPAMCWQEGLDTILHVFALEDNHTPDFPPPGTNTPKAVAYFRSVKPEAAGGCTWEEAELYCVDTVYTFAHDCDCTDDGKVAIAWIAPVAGATELECDNDVYYMISNDGGLSWDPRVNITNNTYGEDGYRPYTDLSVLIDATNDAHVVWNARTWVADAPDPCEKRGGRIFHYSEGIPMIRTVHPFDWEQTQCDGGAWNLNACKMTVSECEDKLYCLFVQFNDIPAGRFDDCADPVNPSYPIGAANGDLWLSVSTDNGLTWDKARNLTDTYTPDCDSSGGENGPCESEIYPSMVKFGTDYYGTWPSDPEFILDPSVPPDSPYTGDWFLDVQYVNDHSAGCIVQNEGYWQQADVKWFRLPCVEPVLAPILTIVPEGITMLTIPPGIPLDTPVTVENLGNDDLMYTINIEEDTGPGGWLSYSGFSGYVPAGVNNTETGTVTINNGGIVTTSMNLVGRLIFNSNAPSSPDTFEIDVEVFAPGECTWNPGDPHKMHEPQLPDSTGWDVNATFPLVLADDFMCMQTGWIQDIHFWGSWRDGVEGQIDTFILSLHADIPADQNPDGYSKPGDSLWQRKITNFEMKEIFPPEYEGWYDPSESLYIPDNHMTFFQYDICLDDSTDWFFQDSNTIYWLNISAVVNNPIETQWGWKSSVLQWNDDAVWAFEPAHDWVDMHDLGGWSYVPGDVDDNGVVNDADTAYLFAYLFLAGPDPPYHDPDCLAPFPAADANGDCSYPNVMDYTYLATYLGGGPAPQYCYDCPPVSIPGESLDLSFVITGEPGELPTCCNDDGLRGDADDSGGSPNVGDLSHLVSYLFDQPPGPAPPCFEEGDIDASSSINVGDLSYLVSYLFDQPPGPAPLPCP